MDAAAVVEVFDPGGDPGVDLVAGGEGTPVVVLGCEGGPKNRPWRYPSTLRPAPSTRFLSRPRRQLDAATARTPTSTPARVIACARDP